jgi:glycosyltransferase involved in cell wall biosynthesis
MASASSGDVEGEWPVSDLEVTVVIPTRDRWPSLSTRALSSALAQEDVELEVVVVDDGSLDETADGVMALNDLRVRLLRNESPLGPSAARNRGIQAARAPWVAFLDDDDLWAPRRVRAQLDVAQAARAEWGYAATVVVDECGSVLRVPPVLDPARAAETLLRGNRIWGGPSAVIARTTVLRRLNGFDEGLRCFEDWDLWIRLSQTGRPAACEQLLVAHVEHPGSTVFRHDVDVLGQHERMLGKHRAVTPADRLGVLEWLAEEEAQAGRRLGAARLYLTAAFRYRSAGNLLAAAGALAGARGLRAVAALHRSLRGRTHLDRGEASTELADLPWLAPLRVERA